MINYFLGKNIDKLVENSIANNIEWYKKELKEKILSGITEEKDCEKINLELHSQLIAKIVVSVSAFMSTSPFSISTKYRLTLLSPSICGYDFHGEPMSLAILYCIVYYAYTGKKAKIFNATKQNHILHAYLEKSLKEIDDEISCVKNN